jgi:hypothetical protein
MMNFLFRFLSFIFIFLIIFFGVGCQAKKPVPPDMPRLTPCKITITQENRPLDNATVTLVNSLATIGNGGAGKWGAGGKTNASGEVEIYTNGFYRGAPVGKYKVVIKKTETEPSRNPPPPSPESPDYNDWMKKYGNEIRLVYSLVEKKFTVASTTPLEIEIQEGKSVSTTFDLGKKVKEKQ